MWAFRRNVNCHILHHFLRLPTPPRQTAGMLCYTLLTWRMYFASLILPFLYSPLFISRHQKRSAAWLSVFVGSLNTNAHEACAAFYCSVLVSFISVHTWGMGRDFGSSFPFKARCSCQPRVWDKGGKRGILWFLKHECCENLCLTSTSAFES